MKPCYALLVAACATANPASGAAPRPHVESRSLPRGTIGVVVYHPSNNLQLHLYVWFPSVGDRAAGTVTAAAPLVLFDDKGVLGRVTAPPGKLAGWCENDGGAHYRAELDLTVPRSALARELHPRADLDGVAAFAIVEGTAGTVERKPGDPSVVGDLDGDGKPEALVDIRKLSPDDSGCGPKLEQHALRLTTRGGAWELRCCGP